MKRYEYTINGESVELGTNSDGEHLFIWSASRASWRQLRAGYIVNDPKRATKDDKYLRRAVYNAYRNL